jgi:hypothetical protein
MHEVVTAAAAPVMQFSSGSRNRRSSGNAFDDVTRRRGVNEAKRTAARLLEIDPVGAAAKGFVGLYRIANAN